MSNQNKHIARDTSLDLIRIVALFGVLSVHFFWYTGFYQTNTKGKLMFSMYILRNIFMYCVPLFLVLSGYLMNKKKLTKSYYLGVIQTIVV